MNELNFIKDHSLRKTIEDSIEFIYTIFEQSKKEDQSELYREETYRVIILYVISAIEAVLLYFYKAQSEKLEHIEYKYIQELPIQFNHSEKNGSKVVIAVQEKIEKEESEIGLKNLVIFFKNKKLIQDKTAISILELNDVRNTFHFSKSRTKKCDIKRVEDALQLLVYTIERAPKNLQVT